MHRLTPHVVPLLSALILLASCTALNMGEDLFANGRYRLEMDALNGCTLEAAAFEESGHLTVRGRMTFRHHPDAHLSGEVLAEILGTHGEHLAVKSVPFRAYPHGRHHHPAATFELSFASLPPVGALVKLTHTLRPVLGDNATAGIR